MTDLTHLHALALSRSHEACRLANAKTDGERALRSAWLAQMDREIAGERRFLGLPDDAQVEMTDDELIAALGV